MKLRNVTLATAILLALTGCGSSGGGGGSSTPNSEVNNQQNTQAQVEQQKAEELKKQLTEAQNGQKQAQSQLNAAEKNANDKLATAQQNLTNAQKNVADLQAKLTEAENKLATSQNNLTVLQNQLNTAKTDLANAKTAKNATENALKAKEAELKNLSKNQQAFNQQLTTKNNEIAEMKKNLATLENNVKQAEEKVKTAEAGLQSANKEKSTLQSQLAQTQKALQTAETAKVNAEKEHQKQLKAKEAELDQAQKDLAQQNAKLKEVEANLTQAQTVVAKSEADKTALETQLADANKKLENAQIEKAQAEKDLQAQISTKESELEKARADFNANNEKLKQAEANLKTIEANLQKGNADKTALQAQLEQARTDLVNAQIAKTEAEKSLQAQITEKDKLLAKAQENLTASEAKTTQAEAEKAALDRQLEKVNQDLETAKQAKEKAEAALAEKTAPLSREEVLKFALNNGLYNHDANDFANENQNKSLAELQAELNSWHKHNAMLDLVRSASYSLGFTDDKEIRDFVAEMENQNRTLEEANTILQDRVKQRDAALEKERLEAFNRLVDIAKTQGLSEENAMEFANRHQYLSQEEFKAQLQKRTAELVKQAQDVGLDDEIANKFANENINSTGDLREQLKQLKIELFTKLASNSSLGPNNIWGLVNMNGNFDLSANDFKKLIRFAEMTQGESADSYLGDAEVAFIKKYINLTDSEFSVKLQKRQDFERRLKEYQKGYEPSDSRFSFGLGDLINENVDKTEEEQFIAIANLLKGKVEYAENQIVKTSLEQTETYTSQSKVYNQKYSIIQGNYSKTLRDDYAGTSSERFYLGINEGLHTLETGLPTEGSATYTGKAFSYESDGDLTYTVNFAERSGAGLITGIQGYGDITLEKGNIEVKQISKQVGIPSGRASSSLANENHGSYSLDFYGPKAEEINGSATFYFYDEHQKPSNVVGDGSMGTRIGFGGTRGEIQK